MKRKFPLIGVYIITFLIAMCTAVIMCACSTGNPWKTDSSKTGADSALVAEYIDHVTNPEFVNVREVLDFRLRTIENYQVDSLIMAIPEDVLINVASVVLKKYGKVTKPDIAEEFRANQTVYNNLPSPQNSPIINNPTEQKTQLEAVPTRVEEPSSSVTISKDTVINGKKYKIETKTIQYD